MLTSILAVGALAIVLLGAPAPSANAADKAPTPAPAAPPADTLPGMHRASVLNGRIVAFATRRQSPAATAYLLVVSAEMPDTCQSLRLVAADDPATAETYEVLALEVDSGRPEVACARLGYDDVATLQFMERPAARSISILGETGAIQVPLP